MGTSEGRLAQYFPLRDEQQGEILVRVRGFEGFDAPVVHILPEARSKGFVAVDAAGSAALYHATAGVRRVSFNLPGTAETISTVGRVVHVTSGDDQAPPGMGIEFEELSSDDRSRIDALIRSLRSASPGA